MQWIVITGYGYFLLDTTIDWILMNGCGYFLGYHCR